MERSGENKPEIEMDGSGEASAGVEVESKTETRAMSVVRLSFLAF